MKGKLGPEGWRHPRLVRVLCDFMTKQGVSPVEWGFFTLSNLRGLILNTLAAPKERHRAC